ncbi:nephrocystin-3 isoform X1 [Ananas comosus]|uniref:Nephrocystin-3 isoform X1 n=1 Tax=Ananas comosus TaxID=4615 RepID=A0A6P5EYE7_ANACO|nr:nephrocystin-3 isoform X1 [Ananas comosus]
MAASLLHLSPLLLSPPSFRVPRRSSNADIGVFVRCGVLGAQRDGSLKLRYAYREESVPFSKEENSQSRSKLPDKAYTDMDSMGEFERQLQDFFVEIKSQLEMGNKDDAIDLLRANYESVREQIEDGLRGIEQAATLDIIALGYMGVGDFKIVEHLLDTLDEIVSMLNDDVPLVDSILVHMGSMFTALCKFEDALHAYERSLKILEVYFGNQSPFLILPLMGIAKVLRSIGRSTKAIAVYQRAVDILEKKRGMGSEELVVPLSGLGNLLLSEGKAVEAENCFSRILEIYKEAYGENDGRTGMAMSSFAHALCAKGNVEEAIDMYKRGLQVIKNTNYMALDDSLLEKMRVDLAELLHVSGREQEGRELLQECLVITERFKGIEHPNSVTHLLNLAASHSRSKNFVEAERLLRTCLHIMSKSVRPDDQSITVPMLHLAVTLYNLNQDQEAESLALEAVRIREGSFGEESLPVGEALDCLVSVQARLGKNDGDILCNLKRILSIQERELGYESEEVMLTLKKIVFYLDKMGKKDEKLPIQRRLSMLKTRYKQNVPI